MNEIALKEKFPDVDPSLYEYLSDGGDSDDEAADDGDFDGVQLNESFGNAIVVDNIPKVGTEKLEKLKKVLCKIFFKSQNRADRIAMPAGDDGKTLGFAFIEFDDDKAAAEAVKQRNNFKLDKAHVFKVNRYPDLARFANTPEEYAEPAAPAYEQQEDLLAFLGDAAVRDQFLLRHANTTEIQWVRSDGITELDYDGAKQRAAGRRTWCDMYTLWSPRGTYLATYHRQGIALWGGKSWNQMQKFPQAGVQHCCFSPRENYVVTWNGRDDGKDPKACMTWNLKTGRAMRPFAVWKGSQWPVFRWSHDDKYFARRTQQGTGIQVYETPSCKMVGNKPLRAAGVVDFQWSPGGSVLAYWASEGDNTPARVTILDLATGGKEIRSKQLVNVSDCKLFWQSTGDFLGVQVTRHSKSGKTKFTNFEIFRMRDKNIPIERLEMKDTVVAFAFEPARERFAVIHGTQTVRFNVSFYTLGATHGGKKMEHLYTLEDKSANRLFWSPSGGALVLAGFDNINGQLEFWNVDDKESYETDEHFMCNGVAWDPSGRLVATYVAQPMFDNSNARYQMENGYKLWTFQGVELQAARMEPFYQFMWRPRPESLLTNGERKDIVKNLRKHMARFEADDRVRHRRIRLNKDLAKFEKLKAFRVAQVARLARWEEERQQRIDLGLWGDDRAEGVWDVTVVEVEELLSEKTAEVKAQGKGR